MVHFPPIRRPPQNAQNNEWQNKQKLVTMHHDNTANYGTESTLSHTIDIGEGLPLIQI